MSVNILLIGADRTDFPNLALMKLSAWHEAQGDRTHLDNGCQNPDKVYISCVFAESTPFLRGISKMFGCTVEVGGYGANGTQLSDEIEHTRPNYDLYGIDYSVGFTSRGCIRNCPWCVVPEKEGMIRDHAPISEFMHPEHDKVILLDNNFLASPKWRENLRYIINRDLKVNFNQGLDIRLVNDENAAMLSECKFSTWRFNTRRLYFAFDQPKNVVAVRQGIQTLKDAGIKPHNLMFYMLVGFDTNFGQDLSRFEILRELGVDPYIMIFNNRKDIPILRHFERWVNWRVYKACRWRNYDYGNSQAIIKGVSA